MDLLKTVHRDTLSPSRNPFNLRDLLLFFKLHEEERDDEYFDWGHGDTFGVERRYEDFENWNPVAGSEVCENLPIRILRAETLITEQWTVVDPKGILNFDTVIDKASPTVEPGLSFKFPAVKSSQALQDDRFSIVPSELRLRILEMLPTASVLDLFLASPAFRQLCDALSQSFWKSRLPFDVPWCADVVLQTTSQRSSEVSFDKLLYQLREASKSGAWALSKENLGNESSSTKESLRLKNRRHVWLNCERILDDIESRHAIAQQQESSVWTTLQNMITHKVISVSRPSDHRPKATSDVYVVPDLDRKSRLQEVTAYFTRDGHIIGLQFQISHESSKRLFGTRSDIVDHVTVDSDVPIIAVMISFGSLQENQDKSAMLGLGIVVEGRSEPTYTIGAWNNQDVIQILRAEPGMEVIGITGEFNVGPPLTCTIAILTILPRLKQSQRLESSPQTQRSHQSIALTDPLQTSRLILDGLAVTPLLIGLLIGIQSRDEMGIHRVWILTDYV